MYRVALLIITGTLASIAGCGSQPAVPPPPSAAEEAAAKHITAVEPRNMAQDAGLKPAFRWRLPHALRAPSLVSFALFEVGKVEDPRRDTAGEKEIALASGLAAANPTELNPFAPPADVVLTGDLRDSRQLKPGTWYRWRVRVIGDGAATDASFYFRTGAQVEATGKGR